MRNKLNVKTGMFKVLSLGSITLFALSLSVFVASAQESINSTGGKATGSGGSADYSIGQVFYHTYTILMGSTAEGVQQAFELYGITAIEEVKGIDLRVIVYPNPTINFLQLKIEESNGLSVSSMKYQLFDMHGKLLQNKKLTGTKTQIDMGSYTPSSYLVRVLSENKIIQEFKIIKK